MSEFVIRTISGSPCARAVAATLEEEVPRGALRLWRRVACLDPVLPNPPLTPVDPRAAARMHQILNISHW